MLAGCCASAGSARRSDTQCAWETKELGWEQKQASPENSGKDSALGSKSNGEPWKGSEQDWKVSMCFSRYPPTAHGM